MAAGERTALRRSSRIKVNASNSQAVTASSVGSTSIADHQDSEPIGPTGVTLERPAKRVRTSQPGPGNEITRSKRGGKLKKYATLSRLPDMPLDILFETFGNLHPFDVLHLARTTKALRNLLMRRSATCIWKQARGNVDGLPDCPADLSEPAYANLLFDPHCHFCLQARVLSIMWECRLRCCKRCLKEHFLPVDRVLDFVPLTNEITDPFALLPVEEDNNGKLWYPQVAVEALGMQVRQRIDDKDALAELRKTRTVAASKFIESARCLERWQRSQNNKRSDELELLRLMRRSEIIDRLGVPGLGDEYEQMTHGRRMEFDEHPLVKQPKKLTDRIWRNISATMIAFAQDARVERLMRERCAHLRNRLKVLKDTVEDSEFLLDYPLSDAMPSPADLALRPFYKDIMDLPSNLTLQGTLISPNLKESLKYQALIWRLETITTLFRMVPREQDNYDVPDLDHIATTLYIATTWFRCTGPGSKDCVTMYPRVLAHQCAREPPKINMAPTTPEDDLQNAFALELGCSPWNYGGDRIAYDARAAAAAARLVQACGRDPRTCTFVEMDDLDARFVCRQCSTDGRLCVMSWRAAVTHLVNRATHGQTIPEILRLNDYDTDIAKRREDETDVVIHLRIWGCHHCRDTELTAPCTIVDIAGHCLLEHGILNLTRNVDFSEHPDAECPASTLPYPLYHPAHLFITPELQL